MLKNYNFYSAVTVHSGSVYGGHYICPKEDAVWYLFNDDTVKMFRRHDAICNNFGSGEYLAYILVFLKIANSKHCNIIRSYPIASIVSKIIINNI